MAYSKGHIEVALLLLNKGADPNAKHEVSTWYTNIYDYLYEFIPGDIYIYIYISLVDSYHHAIILYYII